MAEHLVTTAADESNGPTGATSLREAIAAAEANPGPDTIRFDPALADATLRLTQGTLAVSDDLAIIVDTDGGGVRETPTGVFGALPGGGPRPTVALRPFDTNPAIDTADPSVPILLGEGGIDGILDGGADLDGDGVAFEDLPFSDALIGPTWMETER
jgi:CSLREA domain-containing protein